MLRIPKKVEYGIIAICYMASNSNELFPVKEIANNLNISSEFLSKIMQNLAKSGIVESHQGIRVVINC
jgi:Predicted transcriptional regulator